MDYIFYPNISILKEEVFQLKEEINLEINLGEWNLANGTFEIQIVDKLNDVSLTKN